MSKEKFPIESESPEPDEVARAMLSDEFNKFKSAARYVIFESNTPQTGRKVSEGRSEEDERKYMDLLKKAVDAIRELNEFEKNEREEFVKKNRSNS